MSFMSPKVKKYAAGSALVATAGALIALNPALEASIYVLQKTGDPILAGKVALKGAARFLDLTGKVISEGQLQYLSNVWDLTRVVTNSEASMEVTRTLAERLEGSLGEVRGAIDAFVNAPTSSEPPPTLWHENDTQETAR
ncbi:MAG: hypothetical protein WAZ18_00765 [Alphaproteobacteria bacterium]